MQQKLSRDEIKTINEDHIYYIFLYAMAELPKYINETIMLTSVNTHTESCLLHHGYRTINKLERDELTGINSLDHRHYITNDFLIKFLMEKSPASYASWTKVNVGRYISRLSNDNIEYLHYIPDTRTGAESQHVRGGIKTLVVKLGSKGVKTSAQIYNISNKFFERLEFIRLYAQENALRIKHIKKEIADNVRYTEETTSYVPAYFRDFLSTMTISTDREILWQEDGLRRGIFYDERTIEFCFEIRLFINYVINIKAKEYLLREDDITLLKKNLIEELDAYDMRPRGIRLKNCTSKTGGAKQVDCVAIWKDSFYKMAGTEDIIINESEEGDQK